MSRRELLRLAGGVAATGAAAVGLRAPGLSAYAAPPPPPQTPPPPAPPPLPGAEAARTSGQAPNVPATFGRMFPRLAPASWTLDELDLLAAKVMSEEESEPTPEDEADDEENLGIDAGFTYAGQFIDHDLTFDNRPDDLITPVDPRSIPNARTPAFDLDNIYGSGPAGSPQLYEADGVHLKLGTTLTGSRDRGARDLPRDSRGVALIGDPRDDENRLVAGIHSIFLRAHNLVVDRMKREHPSWPAERLLAESQQFIRLHYQWAVLTDFLPSIVGPDMVRSILPNGPTGSPRLRFFNARGMGTPVEFSVAAYRFGHSMVRPVYRINEGLPRLPVFTTSFDPTQSLVGFQPSPSNFAIDFRFLFPLDPPRTTGKPQASYKFDNALVFPLSLLPLPATGAGPASLAKRNLMRAVQLGLPSGQDVARAMGERPLRDDQILIGKATGDAADAESIASISPAFVGKAPLWTYILAEAVNEAYPVRDGKITGPQRGPFRLGPVGGRIVAETFVGFMEADPGSILNQRNFQPDRDFANNGRLGFADIIRRVTA